MPAFRTERRAGRGIFARIVPPAWRKKVTLAVFNLDFRGLPHREATSANPAVAHAVIGVDTLLTEASKALFGRVVEPEIDVRAAEGTGDFEVDLGFRVDFGKAQCAALAGESFYADPQPAVVLTALGFVKIERTPEEAALLPEGWCDGLAQLLFRLGGREPEKVFLMGRHVDIDAGHEERYVVSQDTYVLYKNRRVRQGMQALADALTDEQIAEITVSERASGENVFTLTAAHINAFSLTEPDEVLLVDKVRTMALSLKDPVFRNTQAWFFTNGLQDIRATMGDKAFVSLVDSGIFELRPGDVLVCNVRMQTRHRREEGLVSTYEVIRVLDTRRADTDLLVPGL